MSVDISIKGLRGVGSVELNLRSDQRVYTLFGTNGIGKTKCLEALYLAWIATNKFVLSAIGSWPLPNDTFPRSIEISGIRPVMLQLPPAFAGSSPTLNSITQNLATPYSEAPVLLIGAQGRSSLPQQRGESQLIGTYAQRRDSYFAILRTSLLEKELASLGMNEDVQGWFVSRAQSDNPYQKPDDNRRVEIDTVMELLHEIDGRIDPKSLLIDGSGDVSFKVDGQPRSLRELSSGFVSLVKLVQSIIAGYGNFTNATNLRSVGGIVLIDELESHLHVAWQTTIVSKLKSLLPNTTFFIATHSPLVLAQLEEGEAYLLIRDDDGVVRSHEIDSPNRRAFVDVLQSGFGVDLNALKLENLKASDQTAAKAALLALLKGEP